VDLQAGSVGELPASSGSYALRLRLAAPTHLAVGCLGQFDFPAGDYLYLGSACGPGGVRARLLHHTRPVACPHWHLDWLRAYAILAAGWYVIGPGRLECAWSQAFHALPGVSVPAPGFGAADCRLGCPAHLLLLPARIQDVEIGRHLRPLGGRPAVAWYPPDFIAA
jgi:Uri superfamily endonuclease